MRHALFAALLLVAVAAPALAQGRRDDGRLFDRRRSDRIDTTVTVGPGAVVALTARRGDIVVTTGSGNTVRVRAATERGRLRFDASDQRVLVDASDADDHGRIEVTVPAGVRVAAQATNGDISIRGTGGDVSAHTQTGDVTVEDASGHVDFNTLSGDITASHLKGDLSASSVSGDIVLSGVSGNVTANSVSGDVKLTDIKSRSVEAKTTGGDVSFDGAIDPSGRYDLGSHAGDVTLILPTDASAQLTISTWNGSIDSDFPITLEPGEHGTGTSKGFTFNIGGGAARVSAQTFSGDVVIRRRGGK